MNYRRLQPGEIIQIGDEYNSVYNPPDSGHVKVTADDWFVGKINPPKSLIYFRRPFKPQKMVRKYRFLKPNEKIQYGDYMLPSSHTLWYDYTMCVPVSLDDIDYWNENRLDNKVVRFVDCVPAE